MSDGDGSTTVALQNDTKGRLDERGSKGDTYDEIVTGLLDRVDELESRMQMYRTEAEPMDWEK